MSETWTVEVYREDVDVVGLTAEQAARISAEPTPHYVKRVRVLESGTVSVASTRDKVQKAAAWVRRMLAVPQTATAPQSAPARSLRCRSCGCETYATDRRGYCDGCAE